MLTIWKYYLKPGITQLEVPHGAEPLSVANQGGKAVLWALVDGENELTQMEILTIGTGHPIDKEATDDILFIGTFFIEDGFVFHSFEVVK